MAITKHGTARERLEKAEEPYNTAVAAHSRSLRKLERDLVQLGSVRFE